MPLLPEVAALLRRIAALGDPSVADQTPEEARALRRARLTPSDAPIHEVRDLVADGVPVRVYRPSGAAGLPVLVHLHGGGWVTGDLDTSEHLCRLLAARADVVVVSVGYRLAPEHPAPAALADAEVALAWAARRARELGADPARIAIGGESAGANLATVVAARSPVALRLQALVYPATDLRCAGPSYDEFATGHLLTAAGMRWFAGHYVAGSGLGPTHPDLSPLLAPPETLAAGPPAHVVVAECDVLRDEGLSYARRLAAAGVPVTVGVLGGMIHNVMAFAGQLPAADRAVSDLAARLRRALAP